MVTSQVEGPDFICIGMPKAGTGWLFDQLKYHPDFWMPPVKELNYLSREVLELQSVRKQLRKFEVPKKASQQREWSHRQEGDTRDLDFLRQASADIGKPMDLERYGSLFRHKKDGLSGDVSVSYCALTPEILAQLSRSLPHAKIMLMVRDPIDRAWSHICMWIRAGTISKSVIEDAGDFRKFLKTNRKFGRTSFPAKVAEAWKQGAPGMAFQHFLFDDIRDEPERARREILLYLGADPEKGSGVLTPDYNKKAKKNSKKPVMSEQIKEVLVAHFRDELKACADLFGSRTTEWMQHYDC
jgi:Sulfotransferase family